MRPPRASVGASSPIARAVRFTINGADDDDYGVVTVLPNGFGDGEFTFELYVLLDQSFPVGVTTDGVNQRTNWTNSNVTPYSSATWWNAGNFLIDGHNNGSSNSDGSFDIQFFNGGRARWLFGDGAAAAARTGGVHAVQNANAAALLDGLWHRITLVRRWDGGTGAILELWVDGVLLATETTTARTNMATSFWDTWSGMQANQQGWFFGAEKFAVVNVGDQWEDYKGLVSEMRFWSVARTQAQIESSAQITGNESGLVGRYLFLEQAGSSAADWLASGGAITLTRTTWSAQGPY